MIKGLHVTFFTQDADTMRRFFRDQLGLSATDVGGGWLLFDVPEADIGCHPMEVEGYPRPEKPSESFHSVSFYCEDIQQTVSELKGRGVAFTSPVRDVGYALNARFLLPGGLEVDLYQPRYTKAPSP